MVNGIRLRACVATAALAIVVSQAHAQRDAAQDPADFVDPSQLPDKQDSKEACFKLLDSVDISDPDPVAHLRLAIFCFEVEKKKKWQSRAVLRRIIAHCDVLAPRKDIANQKDEDAWPEVRLIRGLAATWLGDLTSARLDLAAAENQLGSDLDPDGLEMLQEFRRHVARDLRPWIASLRLGATYDSNVPLVGGNVGLSQAFGRKEDFRVEGGLDLLHRVHVGDRLEAGIGLGASASWQSDLDMFDEQRYVGVAYVRHRLYDWLEARLDYQYEYDLLGRQRYLTRHRLTPSVSFVEGFRGRTTVYYDFETRDFYEVPAVPFTPEFDRSGDVHAVGLTQRIVVKQTELGPFTLDLGYRHENISTAGTQFDARNDILHAMVAFPILDDVSLSVSGRWAWEDYKNRNTLDRDDRGRSDFVQTYYFGLVYQINADVAVNGFVSWTDDDSNVITRRREEVYSYDRWLVGVGVTINLPLGGL